MVQAVSGDQLNKLELRSFEQVSAVVPGLNLEATLGGVATKATLRGVDFDARASGAATTVEFYRNDASISGAGLFQALYDVGQIEVLRGPQGTLKGRASPSGSITVHTRKPDLTEVGGYLNGTIAEHNRWNFDGALNLPVIADMLGRSPRGLCRRKRRRHRAQGEPGDGRNRQQYLRQDRSAQGECPRRPLGRCADSRLQL